MPSSGPLCFKGNHSLSSTLAGLGAKSFSFSQKMTNITKMISFHSNYSTSEAVTLFIIGFLVILMIIVGNFLVILAVVKDNTLKNLQYWFIGIWNSFLLLLKLCLCPTFYIILIENSFEENYFYQASSGNWWSQLSTS